MRNHRTAGAFVACVLAVGPFSMATVNAQSTNVPGPIPSGTPAATQGVPAAGTASIIGTTRDGAGQPLGGTVVTISGRVSRTTTSDDNGRYTFADVPAGIYTISASKPGYQAASSTDTAVFTGQPNVLDVNLVAQSLTSLKTIATTRTSAARSSFNTSGLAISTLGAQQIQARNLPNLTQEVGELPGVISSQDSGGRTPNSSFVVHGLLLESKTTIDGHVLTNGVFGNYFTQYANSLIFDQAEVVKGAGLNGVNAGESGVGTVNLRTRDFTPNNSANFQLGTDSFGSPFYQAYVDVNLLKHNKLSLLAASVYQGENGPDQGYTADNNNTFGVPAGVAANSGNVLGSALVQWNADFSNTFATKAQLLKARYRFSQATSLTAQFLGLQGLYEPQGGSYGYYNGNYTIAQCANKVAGAAVFVPAGGTGCTDTSTYNAPSTFSQIGQTQPQFNFFPNSYIRNNEPLLSAELRTTYKDDTFLLRPYTAVVNRFISGSDENTTPGYGFGGGAPASGFYQVTDPSHCTTQFTYNGTTGTGGSFGPCFTTANPNQAYIGSTANQFPVRYATTPAVPNCSIAAPCYTTPTNQQANGYIGFSTPFSQPEYDRLRGATFSYLHPVHDNLYTFSVDYNSDDTIRFSGDTSDLPAGCNPVVGSGVKNKGTYAQPACEVNGLLLPTIPRTSLNIPPTQDRRFDYSATGLFQLTDALQLGVGGYYSQQRLFYQFTDPAAIAAAIAAGANGAEPANSTLLRGYRATNHFDPHVQLEYRATKDLSVRANGGSSITFPYAAQVSGFSTLTLNGGPGGTVDTLNVKNPNLAPETVVAYDLGADYRFPEGSVFSVDAFDDTIHNAFISQTQAITPTIPLGPNFTEQQSTTINSPLLRSYGVDFTIQRQPQAGLGYRFDGSFDRVYYDQVPLSFYQSFGATSFTGIVNGKQLDASSGLQVPYFKARGELTYAAPSKHYSFLIGDAFQGNNNTSGGPPFFLAYANFSVKLHPNVTAQITGQNLFNYSTGSFLGQAVNYAGFVPVGVHANAAGQFAYGNANSNGFANNIEVIQPRTFYFSLSGRY